MLHEIKQPKYTIADIINPFWEPFEETFTEHFGLIIQILRWKIFKVLD